MSDGGSLINLGDLSKPATVLIEKVCNAVGVIYEPTRIKRKAKAEAEAAKIAALTQFELNELEQRALERMVHQETRKQEIIESITAQAASSLPPNAKVEALEEDWIAHFFKQCDTVTDKEMQSLWARLLTGEASAPGSFSKRTVDFVSSIEKSDADLFTNFCQFIWVIGDICPLVYDLNDDVYKKSGITFASLKHLDSIGLISFESVSGYAGQGFQKYVQASYYGQLTQIEFALESQNKLDLGHAIMTSIGRELSPICGSAKNSEFYDYIVKKWFDRGLILSSISGERR